MDPAFPDLVAEHAAREIDDNAKVWTISWGSDGRLEERLDPSFLASFEEQHAIDQVVDALITAAAEEDIAETRIW
jgi:hypothetical protein